MHGRTSVDPQSKSNHADNFEGPSLTPKGWGRSTNNGVQVRRGIHNETINLLLRGRHHAGGNEWRYKQIGQQMTSYEIYTELWTTQEYTR
jgi:hypothetical protein